MNLDVDVCMYVYMNFDMNLFMCVHECGYEFVDVCATDVVYAFECEYEKIDMNLCMYVHANLNIF